MKLSYFDYNATTPAAKEVLDAMRPYFEECYGNPSSFHQLGQTSARALKQARRKVAAILAAEDSEIIFTSGATESTNMAFRSALAAFPSKKEIVISRVEHSSVLKLCQQLKREGYEIREVDVDRQGRLNIDPLDTLLTERVALVSIMLANNETGIIFPIEEIEKKVKSKKILFHVDAVQAIGKIPFSLQGRSIDYVSLSAHKIYGPKGAGALYVKKGAPVQSLLFGGSQERGRRAGTENLPGIVGMGAACELAMKRSDSENKRLANLRNFFEQEIKKLIPEIKITGENSPRLPNTSHILFGEIFQETLLIALDQCGICVSSGSACMSGAQDPSHVLIAMGFSEQEAQSAIRFSFGASTTQDSIERLVSELCRIVTHLRSFNQSVSELTEASK